AHQPASNQGQQRIDINARVALVRAIKKDPPGPSGKLIATELLVEEGKPGRAAQAWRGDIKQTRAATQQLRELAEQTWGIRAQACIRGDAIKLGDDPLPP